MAANPKKGKIGNPITKIPKIQTKKLLFNIR
jgi:hypothetical protein